MKQPKFINAIFEIKSVFYKKWISYRISFPMRNFLSIILIAFYNPFWDLVYNVYGNFVK